MADRKALDEPARVDAIDGEVAINGPGRFAGSLTPEAAHETARRLQLSARKAEDQRAWPGKTRKSH